MSRSRSTWVPLLAATIASVVALFLMGALAAAAFAEGTTGAASTGPIAYDHGSDEGESHVGDSRDGDDDSHDGDDDSHDGDSSPGSTDSTSGDDDSHDGDSSSGSDDPTS